MKKVPEKSLKAFQKQALSNTKLTKVKGGDNDFIVVDILPG